MCNSNILEQISNGPWVQSSWKITIAWAVIRILVIIGSTIAIACGWGDC